MRLRNLARSSEKKAENEFLNFKAEVKRKININMLAPAGESGLISVVLPVYNGEKYLETAVRSVLSQTCADFELIIVDDGSRDGSREIAKKFAAVDERVTLICHGENKKLPAALNTGFRAATGEFYTWISHDNIMKPKFLEKMRAELVRRSDAAMVYGNIRLIDNDGKILRGKGWYEFPPLSGNVMLPRSTARLNIEANNTIGAAFMYRASAAEFIGEYSESCFGIEDYDYWMRMNEVFDIIHTEFDEPFYLYRFHDMSLTSRDAELRITADRPQLMEFDALRRKMIRKALRKVRYDADLRRVLKNIEDMRK